MSDQNIPQLVATIVQLLHSVHSDITTIEKPTTQELLNKRKEIIRETLNSVFNYLNVVLNSITDNSTIDKLELFVDNSKKISDFVVLIEYIKQAGLSFINSDNEKVAISNQDKNNFKKKYKQFKEFIESYITDAEINNATIDSSNNNNINTKK